MSGWFEKSDDFSLSLGDGSGEVVVYNRIQPLHAMTPYFRSLCVVLALTGLLSSCQKQDGPTLVEGQILEVGSNKPVPYAHIEVYGQAGSGLHSGYSPTNEPHQADANGRFSFHFNANSGTAYLLKAHSDAGHASRWGEEPNVDEGQKNRGLVIPVVAPAWIKVRVEKKPGPAPDFIHVWGPWYDQGYISTIDLYPKDFDHVSYHVVPSTLTASSTINWEVNFGGRLTVYHASALVQPFDTTEVVVRY